MSPSRSGVPQSILWFLDTRYAFSGTPTSIPPHRGQHANPASCVLMMQIVGVVEQLGSSITHLKKGDTVGFGWNKDCCQHCDACITGNDVSIFITGFFAGASCTGIAQTSPAHLVLAANFEHPCVRSTSLPASCSFMELYTYRLCNCLEDSCQILLSPLR